MKGIRKILDKVLGTFCCILLVFMTLAATWQVVSRYVLNNPSTVTEELTLVSFVWMALFSASYVFGKQEHMRMSFILDKFKGKKNISMRIVSEVATLLFAALVLVYGGAKMSKLSMGQSSSSLKIPMGYIYLALPISGIVTVIYNVLNLHELTLQLSAVKEDKTSRNTNVKKVKVGGRA